MKKIIIAALFAAVAIVGGYKFHSSQNMENVILSDLAQNNVKALADDNLCPNGCIKGGGGCHCYTDYPDLKEYPWPEEYD